MTDDELQCR